jgi:hypothetical protein
LIKILRSLPLAVLLAGCGGAQGPPPPVARATTTPPASDEISPLSSRDASATPAPAPGATTVHAGSEANATLPPGHPAIGAADPHGNVAGAGPTRSAGSVTGTITLSPKLSSSPSDVLYVIAKKGTTTLAARRVDRPTFPFAFEISDRDAMMSGIAFEGPLDVVARVSKSGDAIPAKGDLEGTARNLEVPAKGVRLTIDSVRQ